MSRVFREKLLPLKWRGIEFHFSDLSTEFTQDQAEHKSPDIDGANLEATGRAPRIISGKALFRNNGLSLLPRTYQEPWFPDVFRKFESACADRSDGILMHPVRGEMLCKLTSFKDTLTSAVTDGCDVDVSWKEQNRPDDSEQSNAPIVDALTAAIDLDNRVGLLRIRDPRFKLPASFSFSDAVKQIQSATDRIGLLQKQQFGRVDTLIKNVTDVYASAQRLKDATLAQIKVSCERLKSACFAIKRQFASRRRTSTYVAKTSMTLSQIARETKNTFGDLIQLNSSLAGSGVVPAQTGILYFRS